MKTMFDALCSAINYLRDKSHFVATLGSIVHLRLCVIIDLLRRYLNNPSLLLPQFGCVVR